MSKKTKSGTRTRLARQSWRQLILETFRLLAARSGTGPHKVTDLCAILNVPARTLNAAFREALGIPPGHFIRIIRLNSARLLLSRADVNASVRQIAVSLGLPTLDILADVTNSFLGSLPRELWRGDTLC